MTKLIAFGIVAVLAWVMVGKTQTMMQGVDAGRVAQIERALGR